MLKKCLIFSVLVGMAAVSTTCFGAENCEKLLNRCDQCHDKERICENLGRSTKYWKGTLKYMVSNGAEISTDENAVMTACLSTKSEDAQKFCK